jgi:hypothetical protein
LALFNVPATAQERIPDEQLAKAAKRLADAAEKAEGLPRKTDVDAAKASGIKADEVGAVFLPEKSFDADSLAKVGDEPVAVGQLWLLGLTPEVDGVGASTDQLRILEIKAENRSRDVALFLVSIRKKGDALELAFTAKEKEPIVAVALDDHKSESEVPVFVDGEKVDDSSGDVILQILGKHRAKLRVRGIDE